MSILTISFEGYILAAGNISHKLCKLVYLLTVSPISSNAKCPNINKGFVVVVFVVIFVVVVVNVVKLTRKVKVS